MRILLYILSGLIVLSLAYVIYLALANKPEATVEKVLELRNDFANNQDQIKEYMSEEYFNTPKEEGAGLNSAACEFSSRNIKDKAEVTCKIESIQSGGVEFQDAAIFYLKRSGLYPFSYRYLITDTKVVNPSLVETFQDILPKKEIEIAKPGVAFKAGDQNLALNNFRRDSSGDSDLINYSFTIVNLDKNNLSGLNLFFQIMSENGTSCTSIQKSSDLIDGNEADIHLIGADPECEAGEITIFGEFDKKIMVDLNA